MFTRIKIILTIALAVTITSGCTFHKINTSFNAADAGAYYSSGWIVQERQSDQYIVRLAILDEKNPWSAVTGDVFVQNLTDTPVTISVEDISFTQDENPIGLLSYKQLKKKYVSQAQSRRTAVALGAMAQSLSASQPQTTTTYGSGTAYGTGGSASYYGSTQSYSYNPAASAAANAQIQANAQAGINNIESDLQKSLNSLDGYLQKTTIFPDQAYGGMFKSEMTRFDQRPESFYTFAVNVGTERFTFQFVEKTVITTQERKLF
ncbi:hypothetical protein [Marinobacter sp. F4216]|uniref:hypothetical protein n=1 Tax=Marinobacter sp. F4216 TaxID=2874281 RepID=UPI001CBB9688|nr:hypothetical protein [Marinobacter sp. F4216]MBZ2169047.1 hypothetical protein [Marinobacter sp. F4216]